jgi:hypothetical protein
MVTFRKFILASLGLFLLTQCNPTQDNDSATDTLPSSTKTQSKNLLIGERKYDNSIWYSSELTLQDNGTFIFHDQGCYGQKFSQGYWTNNNGTLLLTSLDNFKQKEQSATNKTNQIANPKKTKPKFKKENTEYSFVDFNEAPLSVLPGSNDTVLVYLDKIQLQLRNDTLYCVGSNKLFEGARFYRKRNNR